VHGIVTPMVSGFFARVPYDLISDLDEINAESETADVALIIGANDVVNPDARTNKAVGYTACPF
jgi:NAD/NADP transhydrogenase beta subunit